jgi:hypothetical protein
MTTSCLGICSLHSLDTRTNHRVRFRGKADRAQPQPHDFRLMFNSTFHCIRYKTPASTYEHNASTLRHICDVTMNNYEYRPLDPEAHEIRLLKVQKSSDESAPITLELRHVSLDDERQFNALSYTWGDEMPTTQIAIRDGVTLGFVSVRRNLFEYLKEARRSTEEWSSDWIWIDQISINQDDQNERGHQVGQMQKLYSTAQATLVWPWSWSKSHLEAIQTLAAEHQVNLNELISDAPTHKAIIEASVEEEYLSSDQAWHIDHVKYDLVYKLYKSPYWKRLWIIQEIVLASKYYIIVSGEKWDPNQLVLFCIFLRSRLDMRITKIVDLLGDFVLRKSQLGQMRKEISVRRRETPNGELPTSSPGLTWYSVLDHTRYAECEVPLDRVYGLMGLLPDHLHIPTDYNISELELLRRVLCKLISNKSIYREGAWLAVYKLLEAWHYTGLKEVVQHSYDVLERRRLKRIVRLTLTELDVPIPPFTCRDAAMCTMTAVLHVLIMTRSRTVASWSIDLLVKLEVDYLNRPFID